MKKISARQQRIIDFVGRFWRENNYPPTVRDILNGCHISSTSVVDYNLSILQREGYIRRHPGISRGIKLVGQALSGATTLKVPVIGQIAAGSPIPVPEADTWDPAASAETMEISAELTRGREGVFALKVKGTSMIDSLINDGDVVLMQPVKTVENGETAAVWLRSEKEVTLKKVYREKDRIRLQPANSTMKPIYVAPGDVEIQGKVIAVIRQLG